MFRPSPLSRGRDEKESPTRVRRTVLVFGVCCVLILGLCGAGAARAGIGHARFPLAEGTLALGPGGRVVAVADRDDLVPGTRVLAEAPDADLRAAEQLSWLDSGTVPRVPELAGSTMVRDAMLDLNVLSKPYGVAVAGWSGPWQYVWPRDSALVAVAMARTKHFVEAERVIAFLQRVQPESGVFQARYRPDGTGVPDRRGPQTDSLGWALWAMAEVAEQWPPDSRRSFVERHQRLLDRSTATAVSLTGDTGSSLPPASSDYWEKRERKLTLATAALLGAGLAAAHRLYQMLGDVSAAADSGRAAAQLNAAITTAFAQEGYPRSIGGSPDSVDLGVSYLLPPFSNRRDDAVVAVWQHSAVSMRRPAGGLAPGGSWPADGVSWTTATSSYAMTAACVGDRHASVSWLRWLDAHRTRLGSLPEKVLAGGEPASVAPLAWAAAAVIIAAAQLDEPR